MISFNVGRKENGIVVKLYFVNLDFVYYLELAILA
jgi:hypothetical protein